MDEALKARVVSLFFLRTEERLHRWAGAPNLLTLASSVIWEQPQLKWVFSGLSP